MAWKKLAYACLGLPLILPGVASALVVTIQGVRLEPSMEGASCVEIAGDYPGVRIETDRPGQSPRICHTAARVDTITIANALLIATEPRQKQITITFEHEFPTGINGKIMARAKLKGFFATKNGVGVPTGDQLNLKAVFSQAGTEDVIAEPLDLTVADSVDSALFDYSVKEQYLTAGARTLKGTLKIAFTKTGNKLTFPDKCVISLDAGDTFEDKLESLELAGGEPAAEAPAAEGAGEGENPKEAPAAEAPTVDEDLPPFPALPPLNPLPPPGTPTP
jgi:hypothetical protein